MYVECMYALPGAGVCVCASAYVIRTHTHAHTHTRTHRCQHMSEPCEAGFASLLVTVGSLVFGASLWNLFKLTPMGQVETLKSQLYQRLYTAKY